MTKPSKVDELEEWSPATGLAGPPVRVAEVVKMSCIYIIQSIKGRNIYIGSSRENIPDVRLRSHNDGKTQSTKFGRPWTLVHSETYNTYTEARKREIFLKSGRGRELVKEIIINK